MRRNIINPRPDYVSKVENLGLTFHEKYWLEDAYYQFSMAEIKEIEKASKECYDMSCQAVEALLYDEQKLDLLKIPAEIRDFIRSSWEEDDLSLYGRFDFAFVNGVPKLLEFNADTPTTLLEASVIQWQWKEEVFPKADQFNSLEGSLIQSWKDIHDVYGCERYYFAGIDDVTEDYNKLVYILATAAEAGLTTCELDIRDVREVDGSLYGLDNEPINCMFKLYPWETMFEENLGICATEMCWIEPLLKSLMSNKAMLPILYEMFPNSPYILPAFFEQKHLRSYCKKTDFLS